MNSLKITIVLFALMSVLILSNAFFVNNCTNYYKSSVQNLPSVSSESCAELAESLKEEWERSALLLSFSSCDNELRHVSELFCELSSYASSKDSVGFEKTRSTLYFAISRIGELEELGFEDIF